MEFGAPRYQMQLGSLQIEGTLQIQSFSFLASFESVSYAVLNFQFLLPHLQVLFIDIIKLKFCAR